MATSSKTSGRKKSAPASSKSAGRAANPAPPLRREITAAVLAFLAVLLGIGYFNTEGRVIAFVVELFRGLLGYGAWILAPILLLTAIVLGFHHGRPVAFRAFCLLSLPLVFAAMGQIMVADALPGPFVLREAAETLFEEGKEVSCGGVLGGLFGISLESAFGRTGGFLRTCIAANGSAN